MMFTGENESSRSPGIFAKDMFYCQISFQMTKTQNVVTG